MSMEVDFVYPRQRDDVASIEAAVKSFDTNMNKMMLLMKELGIALEGVSRSFDALTSFSFSNDNVRNYVRHFSEEIIRMKEGVPFQNYNRLVHSDVLMPVKGIKTSLKVTKTAAEKREDAFDSYKKSKSKVNSIERAYAKNNKSLDTSKEYPKQKVKRESRLAFFHDQDSVFQGAFKELVTTVEEVASTTMKRYLDLNAEYMAGVIEALTKSDPTVESAVHLYGQQLKVIRQKMEKDAAQLPSIIEGTLAVAASSSAGAVQSVPQFPANNRQGSFSIGSQALGESNAESSTILTQVNRVHGSSAAAAAGSPLSTVNRIPAVYPQNNRSASFNGANSVQDSEIMSCVATHMGPNMVSNSALPRPQYPPLTGGGSTVTPVAGGGPRFTGSTATAHTDPQSYVAPSLTQQALNQRQNASSTGARPPPQYNFGRASTSQVSSVPAPNRYVADQNKQL